MVSTFFSTKKKKKKRNKGKQKVRIITASFKTARIDWSGIRVLGANRLRWPTLISVAQRSAHCRHSTL